MFLICTTAAFEPVADRSTKTWLSLKEPSTAKETLRSGQSANPNLPSYANAKVLSR